ncbi:MAG: RNB domain-containing ribonuclease [Treponema sp.]|jgi:exoribonuclease-2|nr:RNB domain-containing ribonuclease [Treponema sp.]
MMIPEKSLVAYKNKPALVVETGEKISVSLPGGEKLKVREKDIELLHRGPCGQADIEALSAGERTGNADVRGAWELLAGTTVSLQELAELVYGEFTAQSAWAAYAVLKEGLYFTGDIAALTGRDPAAVEADEGRWKLKQQDRADREAFLNRLRSNALDLPGDGRFLQDVEALAYGRTDKSRTMRDLGRQETPVEAHRLLLSAGAWTPWVNPHPPRFGLSLASPRFVPDPPPADESRLDLTRLAAYAIDSPWSHDPDDAVSLEGDVLYVHIADPAASIRSGSQADMEARGRGATLYLPEGAVRMLSNEAMALYALGLAADEGGAASDGPNPALTFKLRLAASGAIEDVEIFPSLIRVARLSYAQADVLASPENAGADLAGLFRVADRNRARRVAAGAALIDLPETHIAVGDGTISIERIATYRSMDMVQECMLLAGEGAALWALQQRLAFPFVSQETGDLPAEPLPGIAGSYQLRRCMRPRTLSVKPGLHWGLGLEQYTQVTSPLRRYTDLLAHQQIRARLRGQEPLDEDAVLLALAAGEAAAAAAVQAERASRAHWTAVYLSDKSDHRSADRGSAGLRWEGVVVEKRGGRAVAVIPSLALETQVAAGSAAPNDTLDLALVAVKIPEAEAVFALA